MNLLHKEDWGKVKTGESKIFFLKKNENNIRIIDF